ncbi:MAG TPA: dihydrolipoamide acetyltransferase family protein [Planctomycetota bacterium]|nr:dihydrolipoamide acetyltransferase family protein [Planctomycetota bacterium]
MAIEVRMAKLSPTMETGTINRWLKKEGDTVHSGDTLAEVETDKASMPLETFDDGVLLKIVAQEGATAKIDELLAVIGKPGEDISAALAKNGEAAPTPAKKATTAMPAPAPTGAAPKPPAPASGAKAEAPAEKPAAGAAVETHAEQALSAAQDGRVKASPLAKKLARERGIDLANLSASGPGGRIVVRDLPEGTGAAAPAAGMAAPVPVSAGPGEDIPLSNLRQTIAKRLLQSKQTIPHFYLFAEVSMERAIAFRDELNAAAENEPRSQSNEPRPQGSGQEGGVKISFNDIVIKIAAAALAKHPEVNAAFNTTSIKRNSEINIAVAVATDAGLYTPVLRNADRLSLKQINQGVKQLAVKAREKKLSAAELGCSGFTISNLGMFGVDHFFAIINPPEAAILAIGAIQNKPVVNAAGLVVAGKTMGITLSCDHRAIDGAVGAKFMATIKELLEHPAKLLL